MNTDGSTIKRMNEGDKLKEMLKAANKTQSDFARACDVTPTAVQRYVQADHFGKHAWETVQKGLLKLGLNPQAIRAAVVLQRQKPASDLRALLVRFTPKQLPDLLQILRASDEDRRIVEAIIEDRIERDTSH